MLAILLRVFFTPGARKIFIIPNNIIPVIYMGFKYLNVVQNKRYNINKGEHRSPFKVKGNKIKYHFDVTKLRIQFLIDI